MTTPSTPTSLRIHQYAGLEMGPKLIVLGAVHGNEVCGTQAITRLLGEFDSGALHLTRGTVTFVPIVNPLAYAKGQRQGDRNLNRNLFPTDTPRDFEDRIANRLCPLLAAHDVLLDLHSFHTAGEPFTMLGPVDNEGDLEPFAFAKEEAQLVAHLEPKRVVEGWMGAYARGVKRRREANARSVEGLAGAVGSGAGGAGSNGSGSAPGTQSAAGPTYAPALLDSRYGVGTSEYMRAHGGWGVTLECGQHADPRAPEVAYRAIRQTLALLKMADIALEPARSEFEILQLADVIDRDSDGDVFARAWASFDAVKAGELIGTRANGEKITAASDGHIVFPNPNALPGAEWFYFAKRSGRSVG